MGTPFPSYGPQALRGRPLRKRRSIHMQTTMAIQNFTTVFDRRISVYSIHTLGKYVFCNNERKMHSHIRGISSAPSVIRYFGKTLCLNCDAYC